MVVRLYQNIASPLADRIADSLMSDLKGGLLPKLGIEEIRAEIKKETVDMDLHPKTLAMLEGMTTRKVVYKASEWMSAKGKS